MKHLSVTLVMLFWGYLSLLGQPASPVRLSETYELANIILALTDYGKTDPWEVSQQSAYYQEVRTYFDAYRHHPLLSKVNYSRQQWQNYLSFRTDSYAFIFDESNHLVRKIAFSANSGFNPFEENLALIEDFVQTTRFRQFYTSHIPYYKGLASAYLVSQRYPEMLQFLENELGKQPALSSYAIVMSPLVGRMNCHRVVEGVGTDFITLPSFILTGKTLQTASQEEIASGTHMLFTELDHAFVNPMTELHQSLVKTHFSNQRWDTGSGYEKDSLATFNEYMTWAVYNLYVQHYFPSVAKKVSLEWAMQNETRGFYASNLFNKELEAMYQKRKAGQTLQDLYPRFIKRLGKLQNRVQKPVIQSSNLSDKNLSDTAANFVVYFSEPMIKADSFDVIIATEKEGKMTKERQVEVSKAQGLSWSNDGKTAQFTLHLINGVNYVFFNVPWQTKAPLCAQTGVHLTPYSQLKTTVTRQ